MRHCIGCLLSTMAVVGMAQGFAGCGGQKDTDKNKPSPATRAASAPAPQPVPAAGPVAMPPEQIIARYSPGVFKVVAAGNYTVNGPVTAGLIFVATRDPITGQPVLLGGTPRLELDYREDLAAGKVAAANRADYLWRRLAADPGRYLTAGPSARRYLKSFPYATGSAFAVSREGILLTNAHVVAGLAEVPEVIYRDPVVATAQAVAPTIAGPLPAQVAPALGVSLTKFFQDKTRVAGTFDQAVIVTQFDPTLTPPPPSPSSIHLLEGLDYFRQSAGEITGAPQIGNFMAGKLDAETVDVVAKGEVYPGKDIAVLKTRCGTGTRYKDKLICLPLGDSDLFQLGAVLSMGFPGAAIDLSNAESASYRVIPMPGEITARLDTIGGWTSFHLTALINHGHSGGPTLDKFGQVIGINVAGKLSERDILGRPAVATGYNVAIPINLARDLLAQAHVNPDPGPITLLWNRGQDAYWAGRYVEAAGLLAKVADMQAAGFSGLAWSGSHIRPGVNYYVAQALADARKRAGL